MIDDQWLMINDRWLMIDERWLMNRGYENNDYYFFDVRRNGLRVEIFLGKNKWASWTFSCDEHVIHYSVDAVLSLTRPRMSFITYLIHVIVFYSALNILVSSLRLCYYHISVSSMRLSYHIWQWSILISSFPMRLSFLLLFLLLSLSHFIPQLVQTL